MTLRFGNGLNGFYVPKPTPEWLAGSPSEQGALPEVGRRVLGHWLIECREVGMEDCYLCAKRLPSFNADNGKIPPCEAG